MCCVRGVYMHGVFWLWIRALIVDSDIHGGGWCFYFVLWCPWGAANLFVVPVCLCGVCVCGCCARVRGVSAC